MSTKADGKWISLFLDADTNALLEKSLNTSNRTKRAETELRLRDHLKSYVSIASEGNRVDRESAE